MKPQITTFPYTQTEEPIFENVFKTENLLLNHVVIEPGHVFPKHPTDAVVYAIIIKGTLSVAVERGQRQDYSEGQVIHIPKGVVSELGNASSQLVELFVIKTDFE